MLEYPETLLPDGTWDAALLGPVADINERVLDCLQRAAVATLTRGEGAAVAATASAVQDACGRVPVLLSLLAPLWCALDAAAARRLAACPYLLIDAGFGQPERWERLLPGAVCEASPAAGYFSAPEGVALVRRTLLFAWHLARSNRLGARVLLGMSPAVAERIAVSRLQDLEALAERGCWWAAPRWEQQPQVWRQLLESAGRGLPGPLREAHLRGLQLLAAACGPPL